MGGEGEGVMWDGEREGRGDVGWGGGRGGDVEWRGGEKRMEMEGKGMGRGMKRREYKCEGKRKNVEGRRRARGDVEEVEEGKM